MKQTKSDSVASLQLFITKQYRIVVLQSSITARQL
jgi:hypothetical protein